MRFKMMVLASLTVVTLPAVAQAGDDVPGAKPEKKVCRREEVTGSIIGSRAVCHTKAEWTAIDNANAKQAEDSLDRQRATRPSRPEG